MPSFVIFLVAVLSSHLMVQGSAAAFTSELRRRKHGLASNARTTGWICSQPVSALSNVGSESATSVTTRSPTVLNAVSSLTVRGGRRREFFRRIRRSVFTSVGLSSVRAQGKAFPSDTLERKIQEIRQQQELTGQIISFEIRNIDGERDRSGIVRIQLEPSWAPHGVARFEQLTDVGFWNSARIFRVVPGFMVQFGIHASPTVQEEWREDTIPDDPVRVSNERGTVVFATAGPNSRTTQIFINTRRQGNAFLDNQGFAPIGRVVEGMEYVDRLYAGYESSSDGNGPKQGLVQLKGNSYLKERFPKISYISKASFD